MEDKAVNQTAIAAAQALPGPLTKSRFKLALQCPTKLHYAKRGSGYRNKNEDNEFLEALADGGHQVGMLAKFRYHPDPVGAQITVETLDKDEALRQTQAFLAQPGRVVIAEAALAYETFFVRVDILIRDGDTIELIEVKSKSVGDADIKKRFAQADWKPYIYDVAFQALVAEKVFPGRKIVPKLLLVNKGAACNVDSLHQYFRIVPDIQNRTVQVQVSPAFNRTMAVNLNILHEENVTDVVERLRAAPIAVKGLAEPHNSALEPFMNWAATIQQQPDAFFGGLTKDCKSCEFRAEHGDTARSGVHECWEKALAQGMIAGQGDPRDRRIPLSVDIWGGLFGARSKAEEVLEAKRAFISDVQPDDIRQEDKDGVVGFHPMERRMAQVTAFRGGASFVIKPERLQTMDTWQWPLHAIDFETSTAALPFFAGMRPYETVAFQFSHHILHREGAAVRVEHATQWINVNPAVNPSLDFVRALRSALMPNGQLQGTVFRYHNHENTVLRALRHVIDASQAADKQQLIDFIDLITKPSSAEAKKGAQPGTKAMVDLYLLVQEGYYSKVAGGSISLKHILPSILHDAPRVAAHFSRPGVFGSHAVSSRNFSAQDGHVWLQPALGNDPYKTLPPIFPGQQRQDLNEMLVRLAGEDGDETAINQGGLAMTAWNFTQFAEVSEAERGAIKAALYRYCELDTLAMVMLLMGLYELRGQPLPLVAVQ